MGHPAGDLWQPTLADEELSAKMGHPVLHGWQKLRAKAALGAGVVEEDGGEWGEGGEFVVAGGFG